MIKRILIFVIFFLGTIPALAETVDTAWVKRYNGTGNSSDYAYAIAVDDSGNVYVTGYSVGSGTGSDYATIKYYPNGDTAWVRRYNSSGDDGDMAVAVAVGKSGNVYVTGSSSDGWAQEQVWITAAYDKDGDTIWTREYGGSFGDIAYDLVVDENENIYVTGNIQDDLVTIKYYSNGDTAWVRRYSWLSGLPSGHPLALYDSSYVYVIGKMTDVYMSIIIKYTNGGDTVWTMTDTSFRCEAIEVDDSNYVYVAGECGVTDGYCTRKYKSNGDTVWTRTTVDDAVVYDLAVDRFYNVFVTGRSNNQNGPRDYATVKHYPNGEVAWIRTYNGPANDEDKAYAIAVDTNGNAYVTGYSVGVGTDYDYLTLGYTPNGDTLWTSRYNGSGNNSDWANSIAIDRLGNVYVTGGGFGSGTYADYVTIKYVQTGTVVDEPGYREPPSEFALSQNYPNPFNASTKIEFALKNSGFVSLDIYNVLGRKVRTLVSEDLPVGHKSIIWDGKDDSGNDVASGTYFYRIKTKEFSESKKLVLLK